MVGCDCDEAFGDVLPALKTFGGADKVVHVGPLGSGNTVKCINNIMGAGKYRQAIDICLFRCFILNTKLISFPS